MLNASVNILAYIYICKYTCIYIYIRECLRFQYISKKMRGAQRVKGLLNVGLWNVHGLNYQEGNKLDSPDFHEYIGEMDLVCLIETHHSTEAQLAVEGYEIVHAAKPKHKNAKKKSGGMALLIHDSIADKVQVKRVDHDCCIT